MSEPVSPPTPASLSVSEVIARHNLTGPEINAVLDAIHGAYAEGKAVGERQYLAQLYRDEAINPVSAALSGRSCAPDSAPAPYVPTGGFTLATLLTEMYGMPRSQPVRAELPPYGYDRPRAIHAVPTTPALADQTQENPS